MSSTTITVVAYERGSGPPIEVQLYWVGEEVHLTIDSRELRLGDLVFTKQDWFDLMSGSEILYRPSERGPDVGYSKDGGWYGIPPGRRE